LGSTIGSSRKKFYDNQKQKPLIVTKNVKIKRGGNVLNSQQSEIQNIDFQRIVDRAVCSIMISSYDEIIYANQSLYDLIGYPYNEELKWQTILHPLYHNLFQMRFDKVFTHHEPLESFNVQVVKMDGSVVDIEITALPYISGDNTYAQIQIRKMENVNNEYQTENKLIQTEKLAALGEITAGIIHEIRNPLTSIKGFFQLMKAGTLDIKEYFSILSSEIDRIETMAGNVLSFAKPVKKMEKQNMVRILNDVHMLMNVYASQKEINLKWNPPEQEVFVLGEEAQLKQVFVNLIKNAIEATDQGGEVSIHINQTATTNQINIIDNGRGIPNDQISQIGKPFFTTKEKGTGLGLMITYRIIDHHNGDIVVNSEEGIGTTFSVQFPNIS
jgi:two-component system, sporulation sensor kinase A